MAIATLLFGLVSGVLMPEACARTNPRSILVTNSVDVTAYPVGSSGDVAPIAVTTDMVAPTSIARDPDGRLYVTNSATNTVTIYAANSNGNVPPLAVIGGSKTLISDPVGIALDANKNIYVLNAAGQGSITVYPPIASSTGILNEVPSAIIAGKKTQLKSPTGIAVGSHGAIYVTNELGGPKVRHQPNDLGSITIYSAGSSGDVPPMTTISGAATGLSFPIRIALDPNDDIYIANSQTANSATYEASITVYAAGSSGDAAPIATISGTNTNLLASGIAVDANRNIYTIGYVSNVGYAIGVFPAGSNGDVSPSATIVGAGTELSSPTGLALDSNQNLYALNSYTAPNGSPRITVYSAGSTGDAAPIATISSAFTGLSGASGIAVAPNVTGLLVGSSAGGIYVANSEGGPAGTGSVTLHDAHSYATGEPYATIAGDQTGLFYPFGIALDAQDNIFVLNLQNQITEYASGSSGNVGPIATLMVDANLRTYPTAIAVDRHDKLYIANQANVECGPYGQSCHQIAPDKVEIFRSNGRDGAGAVRWSTSAVISGVGTQLASPSGIAVDRNGTIYVANQGPICVASVFLGRDVFTVGPAAFEAAGSITSYAAGSSGDAAPIATISGPHTQLGSPHAIALDPSGNIYVLNSSGGCGAVNGGRGGKRLGVKPQSIIYLVPGVFDVGPVTQNVLVFAAGSKGDVAPIATIGGKFTAIDFPSGIAIGPAMP